ncbi:MAG: DUF4136 domain-containing protein [Chitinophagaceae bacterium]
MKLGKFIYSAAFAALIGTGCSSPVYVQKDETADFSGYNTYMWVDTRASETDQSARATAYADLSIHNSVNAELNKMGWREVTSDPDVLLMYDVLVQRTTTQQRDPVYSQSFTRSYYNPYRGRWTTFYYPSQFLGYDVYQTPVKEGTVTITMADARTDKTVWQGWTTERLDGSRITSDEIAKNVRNIFKKFDVAMR